MSFTLAVSGVVQYITYSSARVLFLGNESKQVQKATAIQKYQSLKNKFPFFKPNVFKIADNPTNSLGFNRTYNPRSYNLFYGVWTYFTPKLLDVDPPLMAGVDEDQHFFQTTIGSYLGREPSTEECKNFRKKRWQIIKQLHGNASPLYLGNRAYGSEADNGC